MKIELSTLVKRGSQTLNSKKDGNGPVVGLFSFAAAMSSLVMGVFGKQGPSI